MFGSEKPDPGRIRREEIIAVFRTSLTAAEKLGCRRWGLSVPMALRESRALFERQHEGGQRDQERALPHMPPRNPHRCQKSAVLVRALAIRRVK